MMVNLLEKNSSLIAVNDPQSWTAALNCFPVSDIYFGCQYHRLKELHTGRIAGAFFNSVENEHLFFPVMLNEIPDSLVGASGYYDFESCYGYSGPLSTTSDPKILEELWKPFLSWCKDNKVVAGFTRCHPLLTTEKYLPPNATSSFNRKTVIIDFAKSEEEIWASYPSKQRAQIRQAVKFGLTCRLGKAEQICSVFQPLYSLAMKKMNAPKRVMFDDSYFEYLSTQMADLTDLLIVEHEGKAIAGSILLKSDSFYHYHLSASLYEFQHLRPNNFMLHEAIKRGKQLGFKQFHLGGGRTDAPDDSLFKFKESFSKESADFYVAHSIFDKEIYQTIVDRWCQSKGLSEPPTQLLFYRDK